MNLGRYMCVPLLHNIHAWSTECKENKEDTWSVDYVLAIVDPLFH